MKHPHNSTPRKIMIDCLDCHTFIDRDKAGALMRCPDNLRVCHICCAEHHKHAIEVQA